MTAPIRSPCRQICQLGIDGICDGCGRTGHEVGRWVTMSAAERDEVMARLRGWKVRGDPPRLGERR